jgi:hypothetical protein
MVSLLRVGKCTVLQVGYLASKSVVGEMYDWLPARGIHSYLSEALLVLIYKELDFYPGELIFVF